MCCTSCKDKGEANTWTTINKETTQRSKENIMFPDALIDVADHYTVSRTDVVNGLIDPYDSKSPAEAANILDRAVSLEPMKISLVNLFRLRLLRFKVLFKLF